MPVSAKYYATKHVLGNVVNKSFLEETHLIGEAQARIDGTRGKLNSLIALRRSLSQTVTEIKSMGVSTTKLETEMEKLGEEIEEAAETYVESRLEEERKIQESQAKIAAEPLWDELESPLDFSRTKAITRPIGVNTMNLDAQYFNFSEKKGEDSVTQVKNFVRDFAENLGAEAAQELSEQAGDSIEQQLNHFDVIGSLVIAANCTHNNATVLYPLELDVNESLMLWNRIFKADRIDTSDEDALRQEIALATPGKENFLNVISGVTYGSSFVGMMHLLRHKDTEEEEEEDGSKGKESFTALAEEFQNYLRVGSWLQDIRGGVGIDPTILEDVRNEFTLRKVRAHVTVAALGVLPSIKSNLVGKNLLRVTDLQDTNRRVAELDQLTAAEQPTAESRAESARLGGRALAIESSRIETVMKSLRESDTAADQVMNLGTLFSAFDDYAEQVKREATGIPISYFFRKINRHEVIRAYLTHQETLA